MRSKGATVQGMKIMEFALIRRRTMDGGDNLAPLVLLSEAQSAIGAMRQALQDLCDVFHQGRAGALQPESEGYVRSILEAADAVLLTHTEAA